jgi:hypothetical protein
MRRRNRLCCQGRGELQGNDRFGIINFTLPKQALRFGQGDPERLQHFIFISGSGPPGDNSFR